MKILVGLSGGLDSTYAAYLLRSRGHEVTGAVLSMHPDSPIAPAKEAAEQLGIPLTVLDCSARFSARVIEPFIDEYLRARTPNPCVNCNAEVKFGMLCEYAREHGFDAVATGHYSSVGYENGRYFVTRSEEGGKDQSYVLWRLSQEQLSMLTLPLAGQDKAKIREEARALGFSAAEAKESMENCFIPDDDYAGFIMKKRGVTPVPGDFLDENGKKVGEHKGILHYTVGQRKGLGLALGEPVFVTSIDPEANTVTVGRKGSEYRSEMTVSSLSFQKLPPLPGTYRLDVKIRYAAPPVPCTVTVTGSGEARVVFDARARAVTPGQSAVFYDGKDIAFGGFIE